MSQIVTTIKTLWLRTSATVKGAILGSFITGIFAVIVAIITRPQEQNGNTTQTVTIHLLDKYTHREIPGATVHVTPMRLERDTDEKGNFIFGLNQETGKIHISITVPIDPFYMQGIPVEKGKIYDSLQIKPK